MTLTLWVPCDPVRDKRQLIPICWGRALSQMFQIIGSQKEKESFSPTRWLFHKRLTTINFPLIRPSATHFIFTISFIFLVPTPIFLMRKLRLSKIKPLTVLMATQLASGRISIYGSKVIHYTSRCPAGHILHTSHFLLAESQGNDRFSALDAEGPKEDKWEVEDR